MPTTDDLRAIRLRRKLRRSLLEQFAHNGRTAERILASTELSDNQRFALEGIRDNAKLLESALDED